LAEGEATVSDRIKISPEHRDLLYDSILVHLSGIDAIWLAANQKDYETAHRLGQEFCEELHLVMDDLGWGERKSDEPVELTRPPEVVQRIVERVRAGAEAEDAEDEKQRTELREAERRNRLLREVCDEILQRCARPDSNRRPSA
jgi:phosphosulfolactate synthase (CoM biosynthesis protein A)